MSSHGAQNETPTASSIQSTIHEQRKEPPIISANEPFSGHFFDRNKKASEARNIYTKILFQRTCVVIVAIFAIFSIYWGSLWKTPARSLEGWIVDFDGGRIGQNVTRELSKLSGSGISWDVRSAASFPNGASDLAHAVVEEHCWVAVAINAGSTARLDAALTKLVDPSYDATSAVTAFGVEARNENAFRNLLRPATEQWLEQITHDFAVQLVAELASNASIALPSIAPETLVRPVYYSFDNVRPFDVPVATAVTLIGLIYIVILSFFVVNAGVLARNVSGLERQLTLGSLIRVRVVSSVLIYLVVTCFYSLVTLAFDLPFSRKFGHSGFVVFWMLSWFGMSAAGLALESMMTLITIKYIQIFLILWIISNVSVCLWPLDALPRVYAYGYAAPFYNISRGVRTIVFSTKNEVGLNFGVLCVWIVISCITLPLLQWYRRREAVQAWRKQQQKGKAES